MIEKEELPINHGETSDESQTESRKKFEQKLHSFQSMSRQDIFFYDIGLDLRDLGQLVSEATDSEKEIVRAILKRVLLTQLHWQSGARYINENLQELTYSPEELAQIREEEARAEERKEAIEADITQGDSPWWAHAERNERTILNPYIVGFYRGDDGRIKTLYGPRYFKSKRQVKTEFLVSARSENKEVNLLATQFQRVDNPEIIKGPLWNSLPDDLRSRFEAGEILITGDQDLYSFSDSEIDRLAKSQRAGDILALLDQKVDQTISSSGKQYFLHYYSDFRSDQTGRTGVIMIGEGGRVKPFVVNVGDKEFIIEVKGCGKKSGGFGEMQQRTGRDIITGGVEREQAVNEYERLSEETDTETPKIAGSILFNNQGYEQGYILRLSPSTVRASYSDAEVYPDIEGHENVKLVLRMYAAQLVEQIFATNPRILDRSAHTENLLIWGNGQSIFTDFSDQVAFSNKDFPHYEDAGGYMTPRQMLEYCIRMVDEMPGYNPEVTRKAYYEALENAFNIQGINLGLEESDNYDTVTRKIWEKCVAYKVFEARRKSHFLAEGVCNEVGESLSNEYRRRELSLGSKTEFSEKINLYKDKFRTILRQIRENLSDQADRQMIDNYSTLLDSKFADFLAGIDEIHKIYQKVKDVFSDDEQRSIFDVGMYFANLSSTLITPIKRYLEHELGVIKSAQIASPGEAREVLTLAEEELGSKTHQLDEIINSSAEEIYSALTDLDKVKTIISMSFYG